MTNQDKKNKINLEFYKNKDYEVFYFPEDLSEADLNFLEGIDDYPLSDNSPNKEYVQKYADIFHEKNVAWYNFETTAEVLEINSFFGRSTSFLCKNVKNVTLVEFSKRKAEIVNEYLPIFNNLEIIVGSLSDIKFSKNFDYIIVNEVLELSSLFFNSDNPHLDFIYFLKKLLKPNGVLIILASNKFGIKNWLGSKSEYTGNDYDALQNYPDKSHIKLFSLKEMKNLFKQGNFDYLKFYYPVPDIFDIRNIYTDNTLYDDVIYKGVKDNNAIFFSGDFQKYRFTNIDMEGEKKIVHNLVSKKKFEMFTNSFIIIATNKKIKREIYRIKYSANDMVTNIFGNDKKIFSQKKACNAYSEKGLNRMYKYYKEEQQRLKSLNIGNVRLVRCYKQNNSLYFEKAKGISLTKIAAKLYHNKDKQGLIDMIVNYANFIYKLYPDYKIMDFSSKGHEDVFDSCVIRNTKCVCNANIDLNFDNIFKDENGNFMIIDYDCSWKDYIPLNYIFMEAFLILKATLTFGDDIDYEVFNRLGFKSGEVKNYKDMRFSFAVSADRYFLKA